jgi:hypothetical protein
MVVGSPAFGTSGWCGGAWIGGGAYTIAVDGCKLAVRMVGCWRVAWLGGMARGGVGGDEACMVGVGGHRACAVSWHIVGAVVGHVG